jgi:hypothetical protein
MLSGRILPQSFAMSRKPGRAQSTHDGQCNGGLVVLAEKH